ncbi:MAG TPA: carboxypeptidase-like regulatory domain-containing protein [Polyangiaceae bacterium]|jgi:hypothetical protein
MRTSLGRSATLVAFLASLAALPALASLAACKTSSTGEAAPGASGSASPSASVAEGAPEAGPFPIPRASVEAVLNPGDLPPYTGPTGSVEGTITVEGPEAPAVQLDAAKCPAALDTFGKLFREGKPDKADKPTGPRPLGDAVVVAVGYKGFLPDKTDVVPLTIQPNCSYGPRTIAITYGQRLEVSNDSGLLFGPYVDQVFALAVMVAPPHEKGSPVKIYPTKAGHFVLKDQIEPFMQEDLYVFRHPLHAVSDLAGHYRIDGVPVGHLEIGASHPAFAGGATAPVDVVEGAVQRVDLTLTYKPAPKVTADAGALFTTRCLKWLDPATKKKCAQYDRPND